MKCRFYLLDINEDRWQNRPSVRLWGIDDRGKRVLVVADQILPYFYYLPPERGDPAVILEQLLKNRGKFPDIANVEIETKRLLGKETKTLKVSALDSHVLSYLARNVGRLLGGGSTFEEDLRFSVRYITDAQLTPCGWHECEGEPIKAEGVAVDSALLSDATPTSREDLAVPELRIMSFNILTIAAKGSAKPERDPVKAIAVATNSGKSEIFVAQRDDDSKILKDLIDFIDKIDPDVLVGFESNTVQWPYLIGRCKANKLKLVVGRDGTEPHTSVFGHVSVTGRANVDVFDIAGGIPEIKVKTIENLAKYLRIASAKDLETIEEAERYRLWEDESGKRKLLQHTSTNAEVLLELAKATLQFPMQLAALTGLPLDHVMTAAVGFRVDSYLIKQAHAIGELIPQRSEQPFYTFRGALVLEPKTGVHDNVVVLDFSAMYPHLMMKFNLSPDTLVKSGEKVPEDAVFVIPELKHHFIKQPDGFYRIVLRRLINQRSAIKKELEKVGEKSTRYKVLGERERAVKIITNACYGYAGWAGARWYAKEVAESATALGRETITKTIRKAESLGLRIIYGDTDSIFVENDAGKIEKLIDWAEKELELEIRRDREYTRVLFTEAMKRYAGLLADGSLDIVGLEVVRGDWSDIARHVQESVLKRILRDQSTDKAVEDVKATIRELKDGRVPLADLTIRKTLTKPIEDYAVRAPHVEVAKMLVKQGWDMTVGDKVAFVIAKGPGKLFQKAKPPYQVRPQDVDIDYYLENQIKPAAMRVLERFGVNEKQLEV